MGVAVGLILIAFGAILTWAVDADVSGLNVTAVGVILLVIGIFVVLLDLLWWRTLDVVRRRAGLAANDVRARHRGASPCQPLQPVAPRRRVVVDEDVVAACRPAAALTESSSRGRSFPTVPLLVKLLIPLALAAAVVIAAITVQEPKHTREARAVALAAVPPLARPRPGSDSSSDARGLGGRSAERSAAGEHERGEQRKRAASHVEPLRPGCRTRPTVSDAM